MITLDKAQQDFDEMLPKESKIEILGEYKCYYCGSNTAVFSCYVNEQKDTGRLLDLCYECIN